MKNSLKGFLLSLFAFACILFVVKTNVSANAGWWATKKLGGGEGAQWAVAGAAGYAGGAGGAWAGAKAGALIGTAGGPIGSFVGGVVGAGLGAL